MSDDITKVLGVVIDAELGGGNGGSGIVTPAPELVESFDIGEVWYTDKDAEGFYDKSYIACLETPTPVTREYTDWWLRYRTAIPFDARVEVEPILDLGTTTYEDIENISKATEYMGGYIVRKDKFNLHFLRDGVYTLLTADNYTYCIPDFHSFVDVISGDTYFYIATSSGIYKTLNPEEGERITVYEFDEVQDDLQIYQEGNVVYVVAFKNKYAKCISIKHNDEEITPFILWEKDLAAYMFYSLQGMPRLLDEIFLEGKSLTTEEDYGIHKLSIKTGFVVADMINKETVDVLLQAYGFTEYFLGTAYSPYYDADNSRNVRVFSGAMISYEKNILFGKGFSMSSFGVPYKINLRFSRERGLELLLTEDEIFNHFPINQADFIIKSDEIIKDCLYNSKERTLHESGTQTYDNFSIVERDTNLNYNFTQFIGITNDNSKNYVLAREGGTNKYFLCKMSIAVGDGFNDVAFIPALPSKDSTLQYYMRIK